MEEKQSLLVSFERLKNATLLSEKRELVLELKVRSHLSDFYDISIVLIVQFFSQL
jgi:hypothetical protein